MAQMRGFSARRRKSARIAPQENGGIPEGTRACGVSLKYCFGSQSRSSAILLSSR